MMKKQGASGREGPSQRQLRAGELVRHALVEVLMREEMRDPALDGRAVTLSEVRMSPDLRVATCYVTPLGGGDAQPMIKQLAGIAPWLGGQLAKRIELKFAPRLRFVADESFDEASHIDNLLKRRQVAQDLNADEVAPEEPGDGA